MNLAPSSAESGSAAIEDDVPSPGIAGLASRLVGWEIASAVAYSHVVEVRLASPVPGHEDVIQARAVVFVEGGAPDDQLDVVGSPWGVQGDTVLAGEWGFGLSQLVAGRMAEWFIVSVEPPLGDPVGDPTRTADDILQKGALVWPTDGAAGAVLGGGILERITRGALARPGLVATVEAEGPDGCRLYDVFATRRFAVEAERHPDTGRPMVVSGFPVVDVPARLWERAGLSRMISAGAAVSADEQTITVRSTHLGEEGLTMGALEWETAPDGRLITPGGERSPLALASELLGMLPGGEVGSTGSGKEVVVAR